MTSLSAIPADQRALLRRLLSERATEWLARFHRHEILVARTVRGMQVEAIEEFNRTVVNPLLQRVAGVLGTFSPRGNDLVPELFPEIAALRREIEATVARGSDAVRDLTKNRLRQIARHEVAWVRDSARKLDDRFGAVAMPEAAAERGALERPFLGAKVEEWFAKDLAVPVADNVRRWVTTAIQQGLTVEQTVRGLRGTHEQVGLLADAPSRTVAALVRTAATHASNVARGESFKALGVTHWRFLATLDSRTSIICAANDGKVFPVGEGPVPPLHPNCRSVAQPWLGEPDGTRASVDGPVPATKTFPQWLEAQPREEQDRILGRSRAVAWRAGRLSFERMVGADLAPLSVRELEEMDRL